ncbi:MAG TPA: DNA polymerase III subunit epsilon [Caulobacteraceae bacterium]
MAREIVLDTETTGLDFRTGHRLIEVACLELVDFIPTGRSFHHYVDPGRDIDAEAQAVHGISLEFLKGKPQFAHIGEEFLDFVADAPLIAHNASFDRGFVNFELEQAGHRTLPDQQWIDTLRMAQKRFPGMYNSLDALCKRFRISLAEREKHGALIDCRLLAAVYLELSGGKERGLDLAPAVVRTAATLSAERSAYGARPRPLAPRSTEAERTTHLDFVKTALKGGGLWAELGLDEA